MKNTFTIFVFFLIVCSLRAQEFTTLASDAAGDPTLNGIADLQSISYAIDESMDSLWFKVSLHTSLPGDLGIVFGVDTDLVPENGLTWNSSNNTSLLPEVIFTVNRNFIDPSILYGFSNNDLNQTSTFGENDSTIIINMKLSNLDDDGRFNLILGSSTFDCDVNNRTVYDDLPDAGFLTVDIVSSTFEENSAAFFNVYPNPVENNIYLENESNQAITQILIYNTIGQVVQSIKHPVEALSTLDCTNLESGIYLLSIESENRFTNLKFIKR